MNEKQAQRELVKLWLDKANETLASAELELNNGHATFAVNRLYYACFYAATALLSKDGKQFTRHSAVKSEFAKSYIKSGKIDVKWNAFYQELFDDRQQGDYIPTVKFEPLEVSPRLVLANNFVKIISDLVGTGL